MKRARTSERGGKVHYVYPQLRPGVTNASRPVCGLIPTSGLNHPTEVGRWRWTEDDLNCRRCLTLMI